MIAAVQTVEGVLLVDVDDELVLGPGSELPEANAPRVALPRLVAAAGAGPTVVALLDRRPPLAISHDGGATWREAGGGLPPGFAVAIAEDDPDRMLYAARNRLYLSANGGVFWRSLPLELPDIVAVAWID
ncbi:MAG TPA: sialidase family protein [Gaiellaceae bacterium]|nr:sialidase family protein [Gaiellaceae bacterium]